MTSEENIKIKDKELYAYAWLSKDTCFMRGPLALSGVIITSSTTTKTVVTLRNGNSSTAPIIVTLRISGDDSEQFNFFEPLRITDGLYCDIDNATTGVMVVYKVLRE